MSQPRVRIPYLPERIEGLTALATNLWWSWHLDARALFRRIDEPLWHLTKHNPLELLRRVDPARLAACARDPAFQAQYDRVMDTFRHALATDQTWFQERYPDLTRPVAYFCAEFGLHNSVPIYSGGLGILAGDHCKTASDLGLPLVGVGLFYTKGYFDQRLRLDGWQEDSDAAFDVEVTPLERVLGPRGEPFLTVVRTFDREVHVGAWRMLVGRVPVYLLDTNLEQNDPADRDLSGKLYAGGPDMRLRQEWILGVGGVRVLRAVGVDPAAWHANEGHAAFMFIERLRELVASGASFAEAIREVRARSIFTTHTPVPAGHDRFEADHVLRCANPVWEELGITPEAFLRLGSLPDDQTPLYHMTATAIRLASRVNGVARRHGEVSREIWRKLWPGLPVEEVPIGHITNGVHLPTWMSSRMLRLFDRHLGEGWLARCQEPGFWDAVLTLDDMELWQLHLEMKRGLLTYIREEARRRWAERWKEAAHVVGAGTLINPDALILGFARRFATYKRAAILFSDFDRLHDLLVNPWRPVQIIFAGKAHPEDTPGKEVLQKVYAFTRDPRLQGRVAFLEDYEMHLAHRLVQGVDLWLNMPRAPLEACGTSGMKAALNAVPQLSTLDGWWAEGFAGTNGWAIPPVPPGEDPDQSDADHLYAILEEQVVPMYYTRDARGLPVEWLQRMKHALKVAGERFTGRRMVQEYITQFYVPAMRGEAAASVPPD
ncbi:MAG TPA: alpha-glucan family phosphorylase [Gemmatimonadales bacterium]|jgi:starch phosphorylase|nr:alpha-glucan family phosphorylase [Gemmatimonadales bacterium]